MRVTQGLLARRADLEARDSKGATALHRAAGVGATALVQLLLDAAADVNAGKDKGATPLDMAMGSSGEVRRLLEARGGVGRRGRGQSGREAAWEEGTGHRGWLQGASAARQARASQWRSTGQDKL